MSPVFTKVTGKPIEVLYGGKFMEELLIDIFYSVFYNTIRGGEIRYRKYCSHTVCD